MEVLLALFSTARITERPDPDSGRVAWEEEAIAAASIHARVWGADIGDFLYRHLQDQYGLGPVSLRSWPSGLHLTSADLTPPTRTKAERIVRALGTTAGLPVIAAVGRTDHTKGLDVHARAAGATERRRFGQPALDRGSCEARVGALGTFGNPLNHRAHNASERNRCSKSRGVVEHAEATTTSTPTPTTSKARRRTCHPAPPRSAGPSRRT